MTLSPTPAGVVVRDATDADMPAVHAIYAHHVRTGTGTFEEAPPPSLDDMIGRRAALLASGHPWLVATDGPDGAVLGYAYAGPFRLRSAFRYTVEDSVYIAPEALRRGVGRALLTALLDRCTAAGFRQMLALIGDSENAGSVGLHAALGFEHGGKMSAVGLKFGRWLDVVIMQKPLGQGATDLPTEEPK